MTNFVVLCDADNTLWDTDAVFADAQLHLLGRVETQLGIQAESTDRLAFVRSYDQAIAQRHHAHLKYPPSMLVAAVAAGLDRMEATRAAEFAISGRLRAAIWGDSIVESYKNDLQAIPNLLPTVLDGLRLASSHSMPVYVVTEGRIQRQREIVAAHEIDSLVVDVWELNKDVSQFDRLRRRFEPAQVVMIGDQEDRDIAPARRGGCIAALVPSRFQPSWQKSPEHSHAHFVGREFAEVIAWLVEGPRLEAPIASQVLRVL